MKCLSAVVSTLCTGVRHANVCESLFDIGLLRKVEVEGGVDRSSVDQMNPAGTVTSPLNSGTHEASICEVDTPYSSTSLSINPRLGSTPDILSPLTWPFVLFITADASSLLYFCSRLIFAKSGALQSEHSAAAFTAPSPFIPSFRSAALPLWACVSLWAIDWFQMRERWF